MPTSVRLDPETEVILQRLARRSARSKSDILREAVRRMAEEPAESADSSGPYALISDLVGIVSGPGNLARNHKKTYRELLAEKHRR